MGTRVQLYFEEDVKGASAQKLNAVIQHAKRLGWKRYCKRPVETFTTECDSFRITCSEGILNATLRVYAAMIEFKNLKGKCVACCELSQRTAKVVFECVLQSLN